MKLLKKLTIKSLKLNKKRTIVTVIGIMLATALITAIASLLVSFRQSLIDYEIQERGRFHYAFFDVPQDELKYIENNRNVENYYTIENLGYGKLENSRTYDYVYLKAFDDKALQDSYLKLKEGRLPETDTEIVISKNIITEAGVKYKVGDEITLNVGKRIREGEEINQSTVYYEEEITDSTEELPTVQEPQEEFVPEFTKTYKVVGIIERPSIVIEPYTSSGYTVITYLADSKKAEDVDIFTWYKDLDDRFKTTADILGITED
ncbi:MAG: ABC transporter permease, partial [Lachnospiraceae bacterium]|nr:ABC transporter permease [Lachnospiraceae bacterium]